MSDWLYTRQNLFLSTPISKWSLCEKTQISELKKLKLEYSSYDFYARCFVWLNMLVDYSEATKQALLCSVDQLISTCSENNINNSLFQKLKIKIEQYEPVERRLRISTSKRYYPRNRQDTISPIMRIIFMFLFGSYALHAFHLFYTYSSDSV